MVLAISFIRVVPDQEKMAYRALKEVEGVKSLYQIFGEHDFLLILEAKNVKNLKRILNNIEDVGSVGAVKTMLVGSASRSFSPLMTLA